MKIALIGATGNAGSRILAELSRRGHHITAIGGFGRMTISLENNPLATNPKSSELTALSLVHLIEQQTRTLII